MQVNVSVIQSTPHFFQKSQTIQKVAEIVKTEAEKGSRLILFPESYIPGYPRGFTFESAIGFRKQAGRELYLKYWEESLEVGDADFQQVESLAQAHQVYLIIGVTERQSTNGSLYCSMMYFSPQGYMGTHRKLKPTGIERLVWAEGKKEELHCFDTPLGKIGGLICWENYMPQARWSLYEKGVEIYLAPTADARSTWVASMQHIACESRSFVLASNQFFRRADYPPEWTPYAQSEEDVICRGGSVIVSPLGEIMEGPLWDQEGVLRATLDMPDIIRAKMDFDPVGHYRFDG
ncbi:MAG: carbon-nitrogen hydrolase family protein [Bacteroidota bacterium]